MNKAVLQKLIDKNLSQRDIAKESNISQSTVKYWLKKYNLKTNNNKNNALPPEGKEKVCISCKKQLPVDNFYISSTKKRHRGACKMCENEKASRIRRQTRVKMIKYKGGECEKCNLNLKDTHPAVFEFHHIDPSTKDESFSSIKGWSWDKIKEEIDKCLLLCANCHRIEHNN